MQPVNYGDSLALTGCHWVSMWWSHAMCIFNKSHVFNMERPEFEGGGVRTNVEISRKVKTVKTERKSVVASGWEWVQGLTVDRH